MGICRSISMPKKMLRRSSDVILVHSLNHGNSKFRYCLWIIGKRTQSNNWVIWIVIYVDSRRKVTVDAQRTQFPSYNLTCFFCIVFTSCRANRHISGKRCAGSQTVYASAFLIDADQERNPILLCSRRLILLRQIQRLLCASYVLRK